MSDKVVTELVIDADTSAADTFSAAMDRAGASAQGGTQSIKDTALAVAGVGAGMVAVIGTVTGFLDQVAKANKGLADMQTTANLVGLTLKEFQGIQFGGQIAGLSDSQINTGLEKSAQLLNDASRNANSLSKELEANGLSVRNSNGQLITQNQLLGIAADLVSRARNPQDAVAIAQMLGFTKEWVPLLQQGSDAISTLGDEAQRAGAVIDDETVRRAADFDAQWRKSSVEFSMYMKASLSGLLPYVDDLIERSGKFIKSVSKADIQKFGDEQLKLLNDPLGTGPMLPENIGIKITIPQSVLDTWDQLKTKVGETSSSLSEMADNPKITALFEMWKSAVPEAVSSLVKGPLKNLTNIEMVDPKWIDGTGLSPVTDFSGAQGQAYWAAQAQKMSGLQSGLTGLKFGDPSIVASKDVADDKVDSAINSLRRHTEQQIADTNAVGLGAGALALFRAQAAETAAVQANGGKETAEQAAQFKILQDRAAAAADALARAKVANDIKFAGNTALLSPQDVQIATQLKSIYPDVTTALNSAEAAQIRFNTNLRASADAFQNAAGPALVDFEMGSKKGSDAIKAFEQQFVRSLLTMANQALIFGPIMRGLQGGFGGIGGIASFFGGGSSAQATSAATLANNSGGAFYGPGFAGGTDDAPGGLAMINEGGRGEIVDLPNGARVIPHDVSMKMAANSNGGGDVNIGDTHLNIYGSVNGEKDIAVIRRELAAHRQALAAQVKSSQSQQRYQSTGVG